MTREKRLAIKSHLALVVLPTVYVSLVVFTRILSAKEPGGTYYRVLGVNPLAAAVGMVYEGGIFFGVLLIFGTAWWSLIGVIGQETRNGNRSRLSAALGAFLSLFSGVIGAVLTNGVLYRDLHDSGLPVWALLQYACVGGDLSWSICHDDLLNAGGVAEEGA